ncbi:6-hydroxymethylpterin diphosphokinase MptE-like protein [Arcobacter defluvii]|uniref:Motility accessory factor n=1 Tax=Arcobacter defluvii TaxID=873191 RepID=A0AAE7E7D8_9BACT|nr:6-hydroxymethylpterin diphosphokinase MptE-like protein [Arcobacter defluvii]QKF78785.1 motility accessory factor [Arcobacter defluvii]RXI33906.1 hypothetical protein CP964_03460 [Arcobacter defluvii]
MTQTQLELQNALTTTFLANLAFLSEYDNELYHRIDELSRMIENGTYIEKYVLEFIMENGDFDIFDILNNKYLYNRKAKKINDELVKKMEKDNKNSIFNIEELFTIKEDNNINIENRFNIENLEQSLLLTNNQMKAYQKITKDFPNGNKKRLKKVEKLIFAGTLLGRHIPKIANKLDAKLYLVFERNLEIFRLSLFCVDYSVLAKRGVIFSIMDKKEDEKKKIELFCNIYELDNYLIKVSTTNINIGQFIDQVLLELISKKSSIYDYNRKMYVYLNRTTKYISESYKILNFNEINKNFDFFEDKPILYIAAGPSLDDNLEWIRTNQNKFFIVTIGAIYKKLIENDIAINMIITLDEQLSILNDLQFDDESINKISSNTIILASTMTHERVLKKFNQKNLFLYEVFHSLIQDNIAFNGPSVGEVTLDILIKMNAKNIYLIGLDMALNQNTGLTHSENSNSGIDSFHLYSSEDRNTFGLRKNILKVKGNFLDEVFTTALFNTSINFLEKYILSTKNISTNIYNLSIHGAYFVSTIPLKITDSRLKELEKLNLNTDKLIASLNEYSIINLNDKNKDIFKLHLDFLNNKIEQKILEFENYEIRFFDDFLSLVVDFINIFYKQKDFVFFDILTNYYNIIFPYLNYCFNDERIKEETKKTKIIQKIFLEQISDLVKDYIIFLERVIK